jgi:hypothetical protein
MGYRRKQKLEDDSNISKLTCGSAYTQYVQWKTSRHSTTIVIPGDGTHVCSARCHLSVVDFSVYRMQTDRTRVHVCLRGSRCSAPASYHEYRLYDVEGCLFVCDQSDVVHICTPQHCDAGRVVSESFSTCCLTGKVLETDTDILSHGWIEDS